MRVSSGVRLRKLRRFEYSQRSDVVRTLDSPRKKVEWDDQLEVYDAVWHEGEENVPD
jgi:hypothetical protein